MVIHGDGMDWLQFWASIIQSLTSLAWPIAIVVVFLLFREKLRALLPLLKVKAGEMEVSFRLDKAEEAVKELPPMVTDTVAPATPEEIDRFYQIADISPRAAILELKNELEQLVRQLSFKYTGGTPLAKVWGFGRSVRALREAGAIDSTASAILDDLRNIGNSAAHADTQISKDDAIRYRNLVDEVRHRLEALLA